MDEWLTLQFLDQTLTDWLKHRLPHALSCVSGTIIILLLYCDHFHLVSIKVSYPLLLSKHLIIQIPSNFRQTIVNQEETQWVVEEDLECKIQVIKHIWSNLTADSSKEFLLAEANFPQELWSLPMDVIEDAGPSTFTKGTTLHGATATQPHLIIPEQLSYGSSHHQAFLLLSLTSLSLVRAKIWTLTAVKMRGFPH